MKVLFLTDYFPRTSNPTIGTWALSQARALARNGAEIRVLVPGPWFPAPVTWLIPKLEAYRVGREREVVSSEGIEARYIDGLYYSSRFGRRLLQVLPRLLHWIAWFSMRKRILAEVDEFRPDFVYAHHTLPNGFIAQRILRSRGVHFAVTDHDFDAVSSCSRLADKRRLFSSVKSDAILNTTVAEEMREEVERLFPGCDVVNLYNGAELPPKSALEAAGPRTSELVTFITVAMLYERKNVLGLLESFKRAHDTDGRLRLKILGDGPLRPAVEGRIADLGLVESVRLYGAVDSATVWKELCASDAFVLAGWAEPWGVAYTEAMAMGLPIIYSADGGIASVLAGKGVGIAVEPKSVSELTAAILQLASSRELRRALGCAGEALVRGPLSIDARARDLLGLIATRLPPGGRARWDVG